VRAKLPVPASSKSVLFGFLTPSGTAGVAAFGSYYGAGGSSNTNVALYSSAPVWSLNIVNGPVIDALVHTYSVMYDLTNIYLYVDGVIAATIPGASAKLPTGYGKLQCSAADGSPLPHFFSDIAVAC
jgi:hypothetical protein